MLRVRRRRFVEVLADRPDRLAGDGPLRPDRHGGPYCSTETGADLPGVAGITVPTTAVLALERRGWSRGEPMDGGVQCWMERPLAGNRIGGLKVVE